MHKNQYIEKVRSLAPVSEVDKARLQIGEETYHVITVEEFIGVRKTYEKPADCTPLVITDAATEDVENYCPTESHVVETQHINIMSELESAVGKLSAQQVNRLINEGPPSSFADVTPTDETVSLGHELWEQIATEVDCLQYQHDNIRFPDSGRKAIAEFFSVLIENSLLEQELPIRLNDRRLLVSADQEDVANMNSSKHVTREYFVDTNMSNSRKKTEMRNIIEHLSVKFDGIETVNTLMSGDISSYRDLKTEAQRMERIINAPPSSELVLDYGDVSQEYEITDTQWEKIRGHKPYTRDTLPAVEVLGQIERMADKTGRLPTKNELEKSNLSIGSGEEPVPWDDVLELCEFNPEDATKSKNHTNSTTVTPPVKTGFSDEPWTQLCDEVNSMEQENGVIYFTAAPSEVANAVTNARVDKSITQVEELADKPRGVRYTEFGGMYVVEGELGYDTLEEHLTYVLESCAGNATKNCNSPSSQDENHVRAILKQIDSATYENGELNHDRDASQTAHEIIEHLENQKGIREEDFPLMGADNMKAYDKKDGTYLYNPKMEGNLIKHLRKIVSDIRTEHSAEQDSNIAVTRSSGTDGSSRADNRRYGNKDTSNATEEILTLEELLGEPPSPEILRNYGTVDNIEMKVDGSLKQTIEETCSAPIPENSRCQYSSLQILEELEFVMNQTDGRLTTARFKREGDISESLPAYRFGSWITAKHIVKRAQTEPKDDESSSQTGQSPSADTEAKL